MEFLKYQHVERFATAETQGIENGMCYVFPKIDGTNSQLWWNKGLLMAGSRNRQLELDNDNAGFYNWACVQDNIFEFFKKHPDYVLDGELYKHGSEWKFRAIGQGFAGGLGPLAASYGVSV